MERPAYETWLREIRGLNGKPCIEFVRRAREEGWTELGFVRYTQDWATRTAWEQGFNAARLVQVDYLPKDCIEEICKCSTLRKLALINLSIGDEEVYQIANSLTKLQTADLSRNLIGGKGARSIAEGLTQLQVLCIGLNRIGAEGARDIAERLAQLRTLIVGGNSVCAEGALAIASRLAQLETLHIGSNRIGLEGAKAIAEGLPKLRSLNIWHNRIGPQGALAIARGLPKLHTLKIAGNNIGLYGAKCLAEVFGDLRSLDISSNGIGDEGAEAILRLFTTGSRSQKLEFLNLRTNNISSIPAEYLNQTDAKVWRRYAESRFGRADARPLRKVKILLLGQGEAGKSHLLRRIFGAISFDAEGKVVRVPERPDYINDNEPRTHDIATTVDLWDIPRAGTGAKDSYTVRAWDFGGQDHLHASHRYFMSDERAVFLIVCDATKTPDENRVAYWLKKVRYEASPHSPVIIAITQCDKVGTNGFKRKMPEGVQLLQQVEQWRSGSGIERNPGVAFVDGLGHGQIEGEALTRHIGALSRLRIEIERLILTARGVDAVFPPVTLAALRWIETEIREVRYIERSMFEDACDNIQALAASDAVSDDDFYVDRDIVLIAARNLGAVHWVGDKADVRHRRGIEERIFNPDWVRSPSYTVISTKESKRGQISREHMSALLASKHGEKSSHHDLWRKLEFNIADQRDIIELMLACQLIYEVTDAEGKDILLIPDHLEERALPASMGTSYRSEPFDWLPERAFFHLMGRCFLSGILIDAARNLVRYREESTDVSVWHILNEDGSSEIRISIDDQNDESTLAYATATTFVKESLRGLTMLPKPAEGQDNGSDEACESISMTSRPQPELASTLPTEKGAEGVGLNKAAVVTVFVLAAIGGGVLFIWEQTKPGYIGFLAVSTVWILLSICVFAVIAAFMGIYRGTHLHELLMKVLSKIPGLGSWLSK